MNPLHLTALEKVAQTILAYYQLTEELPARLRAVAECFHMLLPSERRALAGLNLPQLGRLPVFKRYHLEKHGYSMEAYMAEHLTPSELLYWVDDDRQVL